MCSSDLLKQDCGEEASGSWSPHSLCVPHCPCVFMVTSSLHASGAAFSAPAFVAAIVSFILPFHFFHCFIYFTFSNIFLNFSNIVFYFLLLFCSFLFVSFVFCCCCFFLLIFVCCFVSFWFLFHFIFILKKFLFLLLSFLFICLLFC